MKRKLEEIVLKGVHQNNLKGFDLKIPTGKLTVVTGLSGSGKSSLVFDTLYAEGQRRYVETFSPYARQFMERLDKPKVDSIRGILPAIAVQQGNSIKTSRSTVGTLTELCDYFKLLMPHASKPHCPKCEIRIVKDDADSVLKFLSEETRPCHWLIGFAPEPVTSEAGASEALAGLRKQGFRRLWVEGRLIDLEEENPIPRTLQTNKWMIIQDRVQAPFRDAQRIRESVETAFHRGRGEMLLIELGSKDPRKFSMNAHCPQCGKTVREATSALFSFNNPVGACPKCRGFGRTIDINMDLVIPNPRLSLKEGAIRPWQSGVSAECQDDLLRYCKRKGIDIHQPFTELPMTQRAWIMEGDPLDPGTTGYGPWYGVRGYFQWLESKSYKMHVRVLLSRYRDYRECTDCRGGRFQPETLCHRLNGRTLPELYSMPVRDLRAFIESLISPDGTKKHGQSHSRQRDLVTSEICTRLSLLEEVGLGYLTLNRAARTLSGGELQRVHLTTCLGSSVVNTLFILDEPSVGLHARDIGNLIRVLKKLRDRGNTIVVVEHDAAIMKHADSLIDLGPGSGAAGGKVVWELHAADSGAMNVGDWFRKHRRLSRSSGEPHDSATYRQLMNLPHQDDSRRPPRTTSHGQIRIARACAHNLKQIDVCVPLRKLVCIAGISGSGKSTLIHEVLHRNLERLGRDPSAPLINCAALEGAEKISDVILVDQSPIGKSSRSNPIVYSGAWDHIRQLFGMLPECSRQGFAAGSFSFNAGTGRCPVCAGSGIEKIEMQFLPDVLVDCSACRGKRFRQELLEIRIGPHNVHEVLSLPIAELIQWLRACGTPAFSDAKSGRVWDRHRNEALKRLSLLEEVGLGYLIGGQSTSTLSGGESQRLKLCGFLAEHKPEVHRGSSLLIFDEPTTGLHADDVGQLLKVFQRLVDHGHTVLVVEHHLGVLSNADWIIELGPDGGDRGGELIAAGTPQEIAGLESSPTGSFLKKEFPMPDSTGESPEDTASARTLSEESTVYMPDHPGTIDVVHAREHNLKNISLSIPRNQIVVVTGLSGSGKSTLAFDLVFSEGQRRFLDCMSTYARQFIQETARPDVDRIAGIPPTVAIEQRITRGGWKSTVATITEAYHFIRLLYAKLGVQHCPRCEIPIEEQSFRAASRKIQALVKNGSARILIPVVRHRKGFHQEIFALAAKQGFREARVDGVFVKIDEFAGQKRLERYNEHTIELVLEGIKNPGSSGRDAPRLRGAFDMGKGTLLVVNRRTGLETVVNLSRACPECGGSFENLDPKHFSFNSPVGWCEQCQGYGVIWRRQLDDDASAEDRANYERELEGLEQDALSTTDYHTCPACQGARLREGALHVKVAGKNLIEVNQMSVSLAYRWFSRLKFPGRYGKLASDILPQILERLAFMSNVGLDYLGLGRSAVTLSGGESQRIRLASQLGSNLTGVLYVLDEPTIGLHPRDNERLLKVLRSLKERGNSLLIVEHDEDTMRAADHLIDLGPGAGKFGGEVVWEGSLQGIHKKRGGSKTLEFLTNPMKHPIRGKRRPQALKWIEIRNAQLHNLKNISARIPLERLTVVTGVSGAGKSTLVRGILAASFKSRKFKGIHGAGAVTALYEVDQSPIGKTPRSCPATYVGFWDDIRRLYAENKLARTRGYTPGRFSFNTGEGRCPRCEGHGQVRLKMNFLPDSYVPCEVCQGARFNPATLEIRHRDRSIAEVLAMSIDEAVEFFEFDARIQRPLKLLKRCGLGYLTLGQSSPTLSGGEAQRLKLVTELIRGRGGSENPGLRRRSSSNLYILEEPSIGLHFSDVQKLIEIIHELVDQGHSVVVIEHNLDLIAEADHVIDLGPEGGDAGGRIVAEGTPEDIASHKHSQTGRFLARILQPVSKTPSSRRKSLVAA